MIISLYKVFIGLFHCQNIHVTRGIHIILNYKTFESYQRLLGQDNSLELVHLNHEQRQATQEVSGMGGESHELEVEKGEHSMLALQYSVIGNNKNM